MKKNIIYLFFLTLLTSNFLNSQNAFYFWPCQGSPSNAGNTCSTPNYTTVGDVTAGPGFTGINPGCFNMNYNATISGGVFTNQNGSSVSPYCPMFTNIPTTFGHRISVNFTSSNASNNATVTYSFTEAGLPRNLPVTFDIFDINCGSYLLTNSIADKALNFLDVVTITGQTAGGAIVNPTFATPCGNDLTVGNTITGNESCPSSTTIDRNITFSVQISQFTIVYRPGIGNPPNYAGALGSGWPQVATDNPGRQYIDISPIRILAGASLPAPTSISGTLNLCSSNSTTLTAIGGTSSTRWFTGSCNGVLVGTGSTLVVAPAVTTTYYIANVNCGVNTTCASAVVNVTTTPTANAGIAPSVLNCTNTAISLSGSGGTNYSWTGPAGGISSGSNTATPSIIRPGTYSLVVSNGICNSAISTVVISQNTVSPSVSTSTTAVTCISSTAQAVASTATSPVSYNWAGAGIISSTTNNSITVNTTGTFNYTVTNTNNGCNTFGTAIITANTNSPTITSTSATTITCSLPNAQVNVTSSSSPVSYTWAGVSAGSSSSTATVNAAGNYNYTVTNTSNGCRTIGLVSVTSNTTLPVVTTSTTNAITCSSITAQAIVSTTTSPATFTWSGTGITSGANTPTITVNAGGTFNYTVTNSSNGCRTFGVAVIAQNTPTFAVASSATSTLNCAITSATISASTTATPVSYIWTGPGIISGNGTSAITANVGGLYNYTVTNTINGCRTIGSYSLTQNTNAPTISSTSSTSITCFTTTAQAIVIPINPSNTVNWSGPGIVSGSNTGTVIVNASGNYTYVVTNTANSCTTTNQVFVNNNITPPNPTASTSGTITCLTSNVNLIGGPAGLTYTWTGAGLSGSVNSQNATSTATGNFTLTVTAANGCTNAAVTNVTSNLATSIPNAGSTQTLVCGSASVTLNGSATPAGSMPVWLGGTCANTNSFVASACAPGVYTLTVGHPTSGCISSSTVAVISTTDVPQATVNAITNSITCTNTIVSIGVTLTSGGAVTYSWSGAGLVGSNSSAVTTASLGGTYTVTITNVVTNCISSFNINVPSNLSAVPASIAPSVSLTCLVNTSTLSAIPTGTNYTYSWAGSSSIINSNSQNPTVSAGGIFTVTITNINTGCIGTSTINVPTNTVLPVAIITPATYSTTCAQPTVVLSVTSNIDPNSNYVWTIPNTGSLNNTNISNPIAGGSGIFTVVVTNTISGCSSSITTITVTADSGLPILIATVSNTAVCLGNTATINITGANTYTWSANAGSVNTPSISVTPTITTTYTVEGTNTVSGCTAIRQITIDVVNTPTINVTSNINSICIGGSAIINAAGAATYTLVNSNSVFSNSISVNPTSAVTYTVIGQQNNCLSSISTLTIGVNSLPIISASNQTICSGSTATLVASGADTYTWSNSVSNSSITVNPIINTNYTVIGTNTLTGCSSSLTVVSVNVISLPTVTATSNPNTICTSGTINISANSPSSNPIYTWNLGNGVTITNQNNQNIAINANTLTPGNYVYTVTVSNSNNCISLPFTTTVTVINLPNTLFDLSDLSICQNQIGTISINNPQQGVTYDWQISGTSIPNLNPVTVPIAITNVVGIYTINVVASIGTCTNTGINTLTVNALPTISLTNQNVSVCENASAQLQVTNASASYTYVWSYNNQNIQTGSSLTINPLTESNDGNYQVTVTDINGCTNSLIGNIDIAICEVFVPEIFTPNGDGKNDEFVIKNIENYPNNNIKIFNRWGNLIYEKNGYLNEFEGYANSGNALGKDKLPAGTYYIILNFNDGKIKTYNGILLLQY